MIYNTILDLSLFLVDNIANRPQSSGLLLNPSKCCVMNILTKSSLHLSNILNHDDRPILVVSIRQSGYSVSSFPPIRGGMSRMTTLILSSRNPARNYCFLRRPRAPTKCISRTFINFFPVIMLILLFSVMCSPNCEPIN